MAIDGGGLVLERLLGPAPVVVAPEPEPEPHEPMVSVVRPPQPHEEMSTLVNVALTLGKHTALTDV